MPRTALGRGLGSLIQEVESAREGLQEIPVNAVDPNPLQPRTHFPESRLKELSDSIRSSGVVQPILVRQAFRPGLFYLVSQPFELPQQLPLPPEDSDQKDTKNHPNHQVRRKQEIHAHRYPFTFTSSLR